MRIILLAFVLCGISFVSQAQTATPTPLGCLVETYTLDGTRYIVTSSAYENPCPKSCQPAIASKISGTTNYFCVNKGTTSSINGDCGNGLPCGPIPWRLPTFPNISSPTPIGTLDANQPTSTPESSSNPVPTPTPTSAFETSDINNSVSTLQSVINATPVTLSIDTTPVNIQGSITQLSGSASDFFGVVKSITSISFGPFSPVVSLFILGFFVVILIKAMVLIVPIVAAVVGIVRKIYTAIMDLIPF